MHGLFSLQPLALNVHFPLFRRLLRLDIFSHSSQRLCKLEKCSFELQFCSRLSFCDLFMQNVSVHSQPSTVSIKTQLRFALPLLSFTFHFNIIFFSYLKQTIISCSNIVFSTHDSLLKLRQNLNNALYVGYIWLVLRSALLWFLVVKEMEKVSHTKTWQTKGYITATMHLMVYYFLAKTDRLKFLLRKQQEQTDDKTTDPSF